jgi:hypothetical protein
VLFEAVVPDRDDWTHVVGVRIAEPEQTGAFARRVEGILLSQDSSGSRLPSSHRTWLDDRGEATAATSFVSVIVSIFGTLLLLATAGREAAGGGFLERALERPSSRPATSWSRRRRPSESADESPYRRDPPPSAAIRMHRDRRAAREHDGSGAWRGRSAAARKCKAENDGGCAYGDQRVAAR